MKLKIDLDFSKCKTEDDVNNVFEEHKVEFNKLKQFRQSLSKTQNQKDSASAEVVELPLSDSSADSSKVCPRCNNKIRHVRDRTPVGTGMKRYMMTGVHEECGCLGKPSDN